MNRLTVGFGLTVSGFGVNVPGLGSVASVCGDIWDELLGV